MNVTIVAGYGDRTDYIEWLTSSWPEHHGLEPTIYKFGTTQPAEEYDRLWGEFVDQLKPGPVIGISFGFSIAARALLEHPDKVNRIISISGPHDIDALNPAVLEKKYGMLQKSLDAFKAEDLRAEHANIMTISSWRDRIIDPEKVVIDGAKNLKVWVPGHMPGILATLAWKDQEIADFLQAA